MQQISSGCAFKGMLQEMLEGKKCMDWNLRSTRQIIAAQSSHKHPASLLRCPPRPCFSHASLAVSCVTPLPKLVCSITAEISEEFGNLFSEVRKASRNLVQ